MPPNSAQTERDHKLITDLRLACGTSVACLPVCQYKSAEEFVAPIAGLMLESHFAKAVAGEEAGYFSHEGQTAEIIHFFVHSARVCLDAQVDV